MSISSANLIFCNDEITTKLSHDAKEGRLHYSSILKYTFLLYSLRIVKILFRWIRSMIVALVIRIYNQHWRKAAISVMKTMRTININEMINKYVTLQFSVSPSINSCIHWNRRHRENSCRIQCLFQNENSSFELCHKYILHI